MFLDQLIRTLEVEQTDSPMDSRKISGPSGGEITLSEISTSATQHGRDLMRLGFSVDEVVHDYGDLCQAITDLGFERKVPFEVDEFRTLNRCLDNAIATAVTEFSYQRDCKITDKQAFQANEKQGFFAHELRNQLNTAMLAFSAAKMGNLNLAGATGTVLERSLEGLRVLIDHSLTDVRTSSESTVLPQIFSVADFIQEIQSAGQLAAQVKGCSLTVPPVDASLAISGNRELLFSAVWNLVQNAFKFTHINTEVTLSAYAAGDHIVIEVKDHCGGISNNTIDTMFQSFKQSGDDRTGLGLGLSIAQQCVISNNGTLTVKNVPGSGCIFTVSLPRHALAVN